jgi:hypothetical protein
VLIVNFKLVSNNSPVGTEDNHENQDSPTFGPKLEPVLLEYGVIMWLPIDQDAW